MFVFPPVLQIMPLFDSYEGIMFMCILVGYTIGNTVVLFTVVLTDGVGVERLPMAMGLVTFFAGVTAFSRPALIGKPKKSLCVCLRMSGRGE